jgi:CheY-like chemotaxis protein
MQRDIEHWKPNEVARLLALVETERRYYQDLFSALPVAVAVLEAGGAFIATNREFRRLLGIESSQLGRARIADFVEAPGLEQTLAVSALEGAATEPLEALTRSGETVLLALAPAGGWSAEGLKESVVVVQSARAESRAGEGGAVAPSLLWRVQAGLEPAPPVDIFAPDMQSRQRFYLDRPGMSAHETFDYRVRGPQGRMQWLRDHTLMEGSAVWGFTVDVTEAKFSEAEKVERTRREAVERLAARVAHVSNNLLMIVNGYGEEILASLHEADTRRADMEEILKAASRLASLTQELSTLARPPRFEPEAIELDSWLNSIAGKLTALMPENVRLAVAPAPATVVAHPSLLEQMLLEILHYLTHWLRPENSCLIEVSTSENDHCRMVLSLPGLRLDEETAGRLFEPFSGPKVGADPPLGLAGLMRPFESLGGALDWDLADPAQPQLVFRLKRAGHAPPRQQAPAQTVVVVEDEASIRQLIVKSLERNQFRVIPASNPIEALAQTATMPSQPDLLVTDLMVPGMDGRTFASKMRERWPALPVLYVSGFTEDPELAAQLAKGALPPNTRFLAKPFATKDLIEAVNGLLARTAAAGI